LNIRNVVSIRQATNPIAGVLAYGIVRSFTRPDRINQWRRKSWQAFPLLLRRLSLPSYQRRHLQTHSCGQGKAVAAKGGAVVKDPNKQSGTSPTPDFSVRDEGSLILLTPLSPSAREFVEEKIGSENGFQPYWPTVVIERRYFSDIAEGILADGLVLA